MQKNVDKYTILWYNENKIETYQTQHVPRELDITNLTIYNDRHTETYRASMCFFIKIFMEVFMKMKNFIIKKLIPILLVLIICVPLVACTPQGDEPEESTKSDDTSGSAGVTTPPEEPTKNELICKNEDVGEAWKKYVLDYEENVEFINIYPPQYLFPFSSTANFDRYKMSGIEALDLLMPILVEIGEKATKVENREYLLQNDFAGTNPLYVLLIFNPNDSQNEFKVKLFDNVICVNNVWFVTEENVSELVEEIMQIATDKGVFTADIG